MSEVVEFIEANLDAKELDLEGQELEDLVEVTKALLKMRNLISLNLSGNLIRELPVNFSQLQELETLNLNENEIEDIYSAVLILSHIKNLRSLFMNLTQEDEVDYILTNLPDLQHLNGLPINKDS